MRFFLTAVTAAIVVLLQFCQLEAKNEPISAQVDRLVKGSTEQLEEPYIKTLRDYDDESARIGEAGAEEGRTYFQMGLNALKDYDYERAHDAFADSIRVTPTYAASFNLALSFQLAQEYNEAKQRYIQAKELKDHDPELESNLGMVLAELGEIENSKRSFQDAIAGIRARQMGHVKEGRTLLQLALSYHRAGESKKAIQSLHEAGQAFGKATSVLGQAVVTSKIGYILIEQGEFGRGEALLLGAIEQLHGIRADREEATSRTDLACHYLGAGQPDRAHQHLTRSIELAERGEYPLVLARALNNLGIYHMVNKRYAEALPILERALHNFQRVKDPIGEGEAKNNLAAVYLADGEIEKGLHYLVEALNLHLKAGLKIKAVNKLISISRILRLGDHADMEFAFVTLKKARAISKEISDPFFEGRVLYEMALHHFEKDPEQARDAATEALRIFQSLNLENFSAETSHLLQEIRKRQIWNSLRLLAMVALVLWVLATIYRHRDLVLPLFRWPSQRILAMLRYITAPIIALQKIYEGWVARWTGQIWGLGGETPEEAKFRMTEVSVRRRISRQSILFIFALAIAIDIYSITYPLLNQLATTKATVARWPLPEEIKIYYESSMNRLSLHVIVHLISQCLLFCAFVWMWNLIVNFLNDFLFGGIVRLTPSHVPVISRNFLLNFSRNELELRKRFASIIKIVLLFLFLILVLGRKIVPEPIHSFGIALVLITLFFETRQFWVRSKFIRSIGSIKPNEIYAMLQRKGLHEWLLFFFSTLALAWGLFPLFYKATRSIQKYFIYPLVKEREQQFYEFLFDSVKKYHVLAFEGNSALIFRRLTEAFEPTSGAGALWTEIIFPLLPYAFYAWLLIFLFRIVLPWSRSFDDRKLLQRTVMIFFIGNVINIAFTKIVPLLFAFKLDTMTAWISANVFFFAFALYMNHSLDRGMGSWIRCPRCEKSNPSEASFCMYCKADLRVLTRKSATEKTPA